MMKRGEDGLQMRAGISTYDNGGAIHEIDHRRRVKIYHLEHAAKESFLDITEDLEKQDRFSSFWGRTVSFADSAIVDNVKLYNACRRIPR